MGHAAIVRAHGEPPVRAGHARPDRVHPAQDWIKLLGFDLERGRFGCYRPPLVTDKWLARYGFMEAAGDRWWPIFGAVYMVTAVKRVRGMRLVGQIRMKKPVLAPGLTPAASPTTHQEHS